MVFPTHSLPLATGIPVSPQMGDLSNLLSPLSQDGRGHEGSRAGWKTPARKSYHCLSPLTMRWAIIHYAMLFSTGPLTNGLRGS